MEIPKIKALTRPLCKRLLDSSFKQPITTQQERTKRPAKLPFPTHVVPIELPLPKDENITQSLYDAIETLGDGSEEIHEVVPSSVNAEWIACRQSPSSSDTESRAPAEQYSGMMKEISSDVVILYMHGGAFFVGSPAASRRINSKFAKLTGGRVLAIQYRLAPQHPFPSALLDVLTAYLSLLYPPPGSLHSPIPASSITLAGESAGANLCLALTQLILTLSRIQKTTTPTIRWNGKEVQLPLPAGINSLSAWVDLACCLPSWTSSTIEDLFSGGTLPWMSPNFPSCAAWPTTPQRGDLYCNISALCHPLISPTATLDWSGAPPMFFACGEERAGDSNKVIAHRAHSQGVKVVWRQFEALPHNFPLLFERLPHSGVCVEEWARFCRGCVDSPETVVSSGASVEAETLKFSEVDLSDLTEISVEDALAMMRERQATRGVWTGSVVAKSKL